MTVPARIETEEAFSVALQRAWWPTFPWHRQQRIALHACSDIIVVLGGNQSGKSSVGAGILGRLCRREGPIYNRLKSGESSMRAHPRRLKIWVAPTTLEKWRSNWESRLLSEVMVGMGATYVQSPHPIISWMDEYGGGEIWGKSQDQGFRAFEGDAVDLIILDEEPDDRRLYSSCAQRFATTNGVIVFTFTPLLGMDWTHTAFYEPVAKAAFKRAERVWRKDNITLIQMGMADNPAATEGAERLARDPAISDQERRTRLYGEYGFVEGLLFPAFQDWRPYFLDTLPEKRPYSWILTADPNKRHGGLLTAIDHEANRFYVAEHFEEGKPDSHHAAAYHEILRRYKCRDATIFADPGGAGAQAILNLSEHGIFAAPVPKDAGSVKASIDLMNRAAWIDPWHKHPVTGKLGAPHCYFVGTLWTSNWEGHQNDSRLVWELQRYRQKPNSPPGTPVKEDDDLTDCARYLELVRPFSPAEPDTSKLALKERLDDMSYREAVDADKVLTRAASQKHWADRDPDLDFAMDVDLT